jgi:2-methylisocitrate lyase-like PEP mutase family enzyme
MTVQIPADDLALHLQRGPGSSLRDALATGRTIPFIGAYDVFSATLAARRFDGIFLSGFSFAASYYGLPDMGFIAWSDLVAYVHRVRALLPHCHLLVDMDDGYGDPEIASHVVKLMEAAGASAVVLEDQQRPRRCGHLDGKQVLPLEEYIVKLRAVLDARSDLVVVARTDASGTDEIRRRLRAFEDAGADALLVDGVRDLAFIEELRREFSLPLAFNQIAGGKSPPRTLAELAHAGVSVAIYSTPCLFAAQAGIENALDALSAAGMRLPGPGTGDRFVGLGECAAVLADNMARRADRSDPRA